ncbi:hypothetical protein [Pseudomonas ogarae]|uniref:hypothetical protein n=1 Tax=Pseudomonas ogarae (strain DSM 112162 / CECT 30235 / F113) TaxID=1114970 RepID=UPI000B0BB60C|nr:hypothetical protein [Pseudomonas ogarae]
MNPAPHPRINTRFAYRTARVLQFFGPGVLMAKMAIFLGGFLALTILIGVLATISPV